VERWRVIVLGVDPGSRATGYGVVERSDGLLRLVECGAIRSTPRAPLSERLREIFQGITEVIDRSRPDVLCIEDVFYGPNVRTTVVLGHARAAVMLAAALHGIPVNEYPPAAVKSAIVGTGMARKRQVALMVKEHLGLESPPRPADAADGTAVALCHLFRARFESSDDGRPGGVGRKLRRD
jgi:crossover junction endodeoxyribonuclease RuvC